MKTCRVCGKEKGREAFPVGGLVCKRCRADRLAERRRGPDGDRIRAMDRAKNPLKAAWLRRRRRARQTPPPHRWVPLATAECELGLSYQRVHQYVQGGRIKAHTYLRRVYVDPADVEAVRLRREAGDRSV